jgi:hypothetical protein
MPMFGGCKNKTFPSGSSELNTSRSNFRFVKKMEQRGIVSSS